MKVLAPKARIFPAVGIRIYNFSNLSGGGGDASGLQIVICSVAPGLIWAFGGGLYAECCLSGRESPGAAIRFTDCVIVRSSAGRALSPSQERRRFSANPQGC